MINKVKSKLADVTIRNIISNYFASGITGIFSILIIPYYLKLFGIKEWGIIAVGTSVQAMLTVFDIGLSQVMPSFISRNKSSEEKFKAYLIFSKIYLVIGSIAFIAAQLLVNKYINQWIIIDESKRVIVEIVVRTSIAQFYFQYINGVNVGSNSSTFITTGLNNNDIVTCILTSNALNVSPLNLSKLSIAIINTLQTSLT